MFFKPEYKNERAYEKYIDKSGIFINKFSDAMPQTLIAKAVRTHMEKGGKTKKIAIIGFDGARADGIVPVVKSNYDPYINSAKYSGLEKLKAQGGIYLFYTGGEKGEPQETSTCQGWATLLTGKWAKETGIYGTETLTKAKTLLFEYAERGKKTVFNAIWSVHFSDTYKAEIEKGKEKNLPVEYYKCEDNDDLLTEKMIKSVTEDNCDIAFCILELPDHTGHETAGGFCNKNPQYVKAVTLCDKNAYKIIEAIESRPTYEDEDWLIIISADHGGHLRRHGTQLVTDRTVFVATNKTEYFE